MSLYVELLTSKHGWRQVLQLTDLSSIIATIRTSKSIKALASCRQDRQLQHKQMCYFILNLITV